jgi:hypothetical protein
MVGHPWIADRAEVDRVEAAQAIEPVCVHHPSVLQIELADGVATKDRPIPH